MSVAARSRLQLRSHAGATLAALAVILILALGVWAYLGTRPRTAVVAERDVIVYLPLTGQVVAPPSARAEIRAPYRAPVERVLASVGQRVGAGDVLVELSHPTAQAAYKQARRELEAARIEYQAAYRQHSVAVAAAEKALAAARAGEQQAREREAAQETAPEEGTIAIREPGTELADAVAARIEAERALLQARADRAAALVPYRQRLEAAQQALREAQAGQKEALIRSPIAGTVLALNAQPGQEIGVDPKTPVALVVDLSKVQVHAEMSAEEAASVQPGMSAVLTFAEMPGEEFEGRVARITSRPPRPLRGERQVAIIEFQNTQGLAKPEMKASVSIRLGQALKAVTVPRNAVGRDPQGRSVVEVLRDGRWEKVVVEPGLSDGRYTVIRSGLNVGETVKVPPGLS